MATRNPLYINLFLTLLLVSVCFSCNKPDMLTGSGILKGKISIGPICIDTGIR
jgi:hypothetical protein